ncbi:MAG: hypothetical protein CSA38_00105 [Flavobacteriales bacterium]|nr:MAG: hypothetical protein CSA38_00105 [Flavobacteriales bacterium]
MKKIILAFGLMALSLTATISCNRDDNKTNEITNQAQRDFGIFKVLQDNKTIEMNGDIRTRTLADFNQLIAKFPNIEKINIKNCGGSLDDETNLQLSLKVHQKGIEIHLMDNAEIASGGVDFFVAGVRRTKGANTKIGVHAWGGDGDSATDYPVGHANHLSYINYYVAVGFTQQQAEDFYYFTINAAPANGIHWMTEAEIAQYHLIKP